MAKKQVTTKHRDANWLPHLNEAETDRLHYLDARVALKRENISDSQSEIRTLMDRAKKRMRDEKKRKEAKQ